MQGCPGFRAHDHPAWACLQALPDLQCLVETDGEVDAFGFVDLMVTRTGTHKGPYAPMGTGEPGTSDAEETAKAAVKRIVRAL